MVDVDGVISLFGPPERTGAYPQTLGHGAIQPPGDRRGISGSFHSIDGIPHFISATAAGHLHALSAAFELVWASGWEEKANEYLPRLLGLRAPLPFVRFSREANERRTTHAHWKLASIDAYAGARPLAWIDDAFNPACHAWADARAAPTLLIGTAPERGLTAREAELLLAWAQKLAPG